MATPLENLNKSIYTFGQKTIRRHLYNASAVSPSSFRLVADSSNDPNAPNNIQLFFQNNSRNGHLYVFNNAKWYYVNAHVQVGSLEPNGSFSVPNENSLEVWSDDEEDEKIPTIARPENVESVQWQSGDLQVEGIAADVYGQSSVFNVKENAIYIFGGTSNGKCLKSILKFNPTTKQTTQVGELPYAGRLFNLTSDGENIYIIGGGSETAPINKITKFNTTNNQVEIISENIGNVDAGAYNDNDESFYLISNGGPLRKLKNGTVTELSAPTLSPDVETSYAKLNFDRQSNTLYYIIEGETSILSYNFSTNTWSRLLEQRFGTNSGEFINLQTYFSFSNY